MFDRVRETLREYLPYTAAQKQEIIEHYRPYKAFVIPYEVAQKDNKQKKEENENINFTDGDKEERKKHYIRIVIPELGYLVTKARFIPIHIDDIDTVTENTSKTFIDLEVGQPVIAIAYNDEYWIALPIIEQHAYNSNIPIEHNITIRDNNIVKQKATYVDKQYETYIDANKETQFMQFYVPAINKDNKDNDKKLIETINVTRKDFFDFVLTKLDKQTRWYNKSNSKDFNQTFESIVQKKYDSENVYSYQVRPMKLEYVLSLDTKKIKPYMQFIYLYPSLVRDFVFEPSSSEYRKRLSQRIKDTKQNELITNYTEFANVNELKQAIKNQTQNQFKFGYLNSLFNMYLPYRHISPMHFIYSDAYNKQSNLSTDQVYQVQNNVSFPRKHIMFDKQSIVDDKSCKQERLTKFYIVHSNITNQYLNTYTDIKTIINYDIKQVKQNTYTSNDILIQNRETNTIQKSYLITDMNTVKHFILNTNTVNEHSNKAYRIGTFTTGYIEDINSSWNFVAGNYYVVKYGDIDYKQTQASYQNIDFKNFMRYKQINGFAYTNNSKQIKKFNYTIVNDLTMFTNIGLRQQNSIQQVQKYTDTTQYRVTTLTENKQTNLQITNSDYNISHKNSNNISVIQGNDNRIIVALQNGDKISSIELTPGKAKIIAKSGNIASVTFDGDTGTIVYTNGINSIVVDQREIVFYERGKKKTSIGLGGNGETVIATSNGFISLSNDNITLAHSNQIRIAAPSILVYGTLTETDYVSLNRPNLAGNIQVESAPSISIQDIQVNEDIFNPERLD